MPLGPTAAGSNVLTLITALTDLKCDNFSWHGTNLARNVHHPVEYQICHATTVTNFPPARRQRLAWTAPQEQVVGGSKASTGSIDTKQQARFASQYMFRIRTHSSRSRATSARSSSASLALAPSRSSSRVVILCW